MDHRNKETLYGLINKLHTLIDSSLTGEESLENILEYDILGIWTLSVDTAEVQQTHHHQTRGLRVNESRDYLALMGGGPRAIAAKIDPTTFLVSLGSKEPFPTMVDFLQASTMEELASLKPKRGAKKEDIHCFTVVTPSIMNAFFETDDPRPLNLLH